MVDANKGHLMVEMTSGDVAASEVPKIGILRIAEDGTRVELWADGETSLLGRDEALHCERKVLNGMA